MCNVAWFDRVMCRSYKSSQTDSSEGLPRRSSRVRLSKQNTSNQDLWSTQRYKRPCIRTRLPLFSTDQPCFRNAGTHFGVVAAPVIDWLVCNLLFCCPEVLSSTLRVVKGQSFCNCRNCLLGAFREHVVSHLDRKIEAVNFRQNHIASSTCERL